MKSKASLFDGGTLCYNTIEKKRRICNEKVAAGCCSNDKHVEDIIEIYTTANGKKVVHDVPKSDDASSTTDCVEKCSREYFIVRTTQRCWQSRITLVT